jgi:hypothetical protein
MSFEPHVAALDYLAEVAKDWVVSSFAAAESSDFTLMPHRFERDGFAVLRRPLSRPSREADNPLDCIRSTSTPTAWARSETLTILVDSTSASDAYEQEMSRSSASRRTTSCLRPRASSAAPVCRRASAPSANAAALLIGDRTGATP